MSVKHGRKGIVKIAANTVAEVQNWTYDEEAELTPHDSIGDTVEAYLSSGLKKGSGSITVLMDPADTTGQGAMTLGASIVLHLTTGGGVSSETEFTGTVLIASRGASNDKTEPTARTFNFVGVLVEGTI